MTPFSRSTRLTEQISGSSRTNILEVVNDRPTASDPLAGLTVEGAEESPQRAKMKYSLFAHSLFPWGSEDYVGTEPVGLSNLGSGHDGTEASHVGLCRDH